MYKNTKEIPAELKSHLKEETFEKSRLYECDKSKLGFMSGTYSQIEATVSQPYCFLYSDQTILQPKGASCNKIQCEANCRKKCEFKPESFRSNIS